LITGGAGGTSGNAAGAGGSNGGNGASGTGKAGGTQGRAIIIYNNGTGTTITSIGGTVVGPIVYNTIPT
jgi:hypothetical protein